MGTGSWNELRGYMEQSVITNGRVSQHLIKALL